ncbi:hypothetical protein FH972_020677 [Carpinus fangiana]|uniref:Uncharacterized protein n=1 Tax=Carpinus fangiana TaxID=176857 RepID=A0A5N6RTX9_9ROSI|nr:hypothetical protein FH972_020677 [Carpinus fangiana]
MADIAKKMLARPILLAVQVAKIADEAQSFKQDCLEIKAKIEELAGNLRQAVRARNKLHERPTRRVIDDTKQVLEKALKLVSKCSANGVMKWIFTDTLPPQRSGKQERLLAADSLVSLALYNDRADKLIIEEGGLSGLLKLAREGSMEAQAAASAIGLLALLGRDSENVEHIVKGGICFVFAEILKEGHMKVQAMVAWAISELARNHPKYCQYHFVRHNAIRLLVSHLAFEIIQEQQVRRELEEPAATTAQMKAMAAKALWQLSMGNHSICKDITESRGLLYFAILLEKGAGDDVQFYSAMALMEITAGVAEQQSLLRRAAFKPSSHAAKAVVEQLLRIVEANTNSNSNSNHGLLLPSNHLETWHVLSKHLKQESLSHCETLAQEEVLAVLEWSSKQRRLVEEPSIKSLLLVAKGRFELYRISPEVQEDEIHPLSPLLPIPPINKPFRPQRLFCLSRSLTMDANSKTSDGDAPKQPTSFDFLTRKAYAPPSWASHLSPTPSHVFRLCHLPTPIHKWNLPNLPNNTEVWLKRDDLSGMQLSGNKVRKLEFLMADAVAQGADCVITIGGIQSNHCRATAVAAKYLNLDCFLILRTSKVLVDQDPGLTGNLLVERLVGAHIDLISKEEYAKIGSESLTNLLKEKLLNEGRRPYVIPVGGSNSLGTWGYIEAIREIEHQLQTGTSKIKFDDIVVACGRFHSTPSVSFCSYHNEILIFLQAKGLGYAINTSEELKFVKEVAAATGVVLDPVYSGKAAYEMMKDMAANPKKWEGRKILFIHTGGLLGLYDKVEQMASFAGNWRRMDVHEEVPRRDGIGKMF